MHIKLFVTLIMLFISIFANAANLENLRDRRYCEIMIYDHAFTFNVYNSIKYNDCPADKWDNITKKSIKAETGSWYVILNGPRFFVVDSVEATPLELKSTTLGGIEMQKVAHLKLSWYDFFMPHQPYTKYIVERETIWKFDAGKPVYEIIDDSGKVYVMQSYVGDKNQLATIQNRIKLPSGWKYRTGLVKTDKFLQAINNKAIIIKDNLSNVYQKAESDFLD
jgi:hypothetical protein